MRAPSPPLLRPAARACATLAVAVAASTGCESTGAHVHASVTGSGFAVDTAALRPDQPGTLELFRYAPGDRVEFFDALGGEFRVHFTRAGTHAVPSADRDGDGLPDYVTLVATSFEAAFATYQGWGLRPPGSDLAVSDGNGGDGRFDVYLLDFGGQADGAYRRELCIEGRSRCAGFMVMENDFAGYGYPSIAAAVRIVSSHELFHAIQGAYDQDQPAVFAEGTAVLATELFDVSLGDFESQLRGFAASPERSFVIDASGPVDPFSYGAAIFFRFLVERHGVGVLRALLEGTEDGVRRADPTWVDALFATLAAEGDDFSSAWGDFVSWNVSLGASRTTGATYPFAAAYPRLTEVALTPSEAGTRLRVFPMSTRVLQWSDATASSLALAGGADAFAWRARWRGSQVVEVAPVPLGVRQDQVLASGERAVLHVSRTATRGESLRPRVCVGTPEVVDRCLDAVTSDAGVGADAGSSPDATLDAAAAPDAEGAPDAGVGDGAVDAGEPQPIPAESSGCSALGLGFAGWVGVLPLVASALRRRRRGAQGLVDAREVSGSSAAQRTGGA